MPYSNFEWLQPKEIEKLDIKSMNGDQEIGYIFEVDLLYPKHLHKDHNSFPLAPERLQINRDMLSPYARSESICISAKTIVYRVWYTRLYICLEVVNIVWTRPGVSVSVTSCSSA